MKNLKEQYAYLWWWFLDKGLFISTIIINLFAASIFSIAMVILHFFVKWYDKFR